MLENLLKKALPIRSPRPAAKSTNTKAGTRGPGYSAFDRVQEEKTGLQGLSPREFEIFRMILDAKPTDEIASALNVSRKTVANYHYAIKSKLGVNSDIELLYFGLRQALIEPVSPPSPGNRS